MTWASPVDVVVPNVCVFLSALHSPTPLASHRAGPSTQAQPNGNFNQMLLSVDVRVGLNNSGAIAIRHRAAQMSSIENTDVVLESGLVRA